MVIKNMNEPIEHGKKYPFNLKIYDSFEDMNLEDVRQAARIDPISGIIQTLDLIMKIYGVTEEELTQKQYPETLTIHYTS
jgi:hypothetical protein